MGRLHSHQREEGHERHRRREHSPKVSLMRRRLRTSDIGLLILVGALLWVLGSHVLMTWHSPFSSPLMGSEYTRLVPDYDALRPAAHRE